MISKRSSAMFSIGFMAAYERDMLEITYLSAMRAKGVQRDRSKTPYL